ncbi:MAG: hypothetical protein RLO10_00560 [Roseovarius indicus]
MVEIADIKDRDSLKAWLEEQPSEVGIWIASRAAARVLPVWWDAVLTKKRTSRIDLAIIPVLRRVLISSIAAANLNEVIRTTADSLVPLSDGRLVPMPSNVLTSSRAAHAAAAVVTSRRAAAAAAAVAARAVDEASRAVPDTGFDALWVAVRVDMAQVAEGGIPDAMALWPDGRGPLEEQWRAIIWQVKSTEGAEDWQFWTKWYDALLDGRHMLGDAARTWEMLEKIALIDTETWDAGPEAVNPVIRKIWEGYLFEEAIAENPLALRITRNETTGKLESAPKEERDLEEIVDGIRQALREFTARCKGAKGTDLGNVILSAFDRPIKDLRRDIGKYRENPRHLFRVLEETRREMRLIARDEGFANDSTVDRLLGNLEQQGEDICVAAPEVLEEVKARLAVRVQLFTAEQSIAAMRMTGGMIVDSDGLLRSAAAQALLVIMDEGRTEADKQAAWTFILGALPRGARDAG